MTAKRSFGRKASTPTSAGGRRHPKPMPDRTEKGTFSYYASSRRTTPANRQTSGTNTDSARWRQLSSKETLRYLGRRSSSILVIGVLIACVVSVLQLNTTPRVVMLNDSAGYALHPKEVYQKAVANTMRSSLWNSNKITVDSQAVLADLRRQFPEIYDASLVLPLIGHRPTLYIELARPALVIRTSSQTITLDVTGRALATAPLNSSTQFADLDLPVVLDQSQLDFQVGEVVLPSASVGFIEEVVHQFTKQGMAIDRLILPAGKEELDVFPQRTKYFVKFNLHEPTARQQAGTYFAVRDELKEQGDAPKEYVDVRLLGRAYYK